ncbi:hypothetical protein [Harryflintia acetispora]|uniref:Uncharacterized protein n=1 Tax=Harryflintia acetispora TaxID=1849041 RepID=A0A9X8UJ30_9FIRM|nr:hypothetical protein [Harryflintia acetispora]TCL42632.1 hypothetical protein EDD78_109103 [Harryflintia acetispora]
MLEELLELQEQSARQERASAGRRPVASLLREAGEEAPPRQTGEEHEAWSLPQQPRQEPALYAPSTYQPSRPAFAQGTAARTAGITAGVTVGAPMDVYEVAAPAQEEQRTGPQPREVLYPRQRRVALREISDEMEFESRQYPRVEEDF